MSRDLAKAPGKCMHRTSGEYAQDFWEIWVSERMTCPVEGALIRAQVILAMEILGVNDHTMALFGL